MQLVSCSPGVQVSPNWFLDVSQRELIQSVSLLGRSQSGASSTIFIMSPYVMSSQ